jgi:hypothetical protein
MVASVNNASVRWGWRKGGLLQGVCSWFGAAGRGAAAGPGAAGGHQAPGAGSGAVWAARARPRPQATRMCCWCCLTAAFSLLLCCCTHLQVALQHQQRLAHQHAAEAGPVGAAGGGGQRQARSAKACYDMQSQARPAGPAAGPAAADPPPPHQSRPPLPRAQAKWPQQVLPLGARVGGLTDAAAAHLGLAPGTLVAQGGADAFIGLIGIGVVEPGQLGILTGGPPVPGGRRGRLPPCLAGACSRALASRSRHQRAPGAVAGLLPAQHLHLHALGLPCARSHRLTSHSAPLCTAPRRRLLSPAAGPGGP